MTETSRFTGGCSCGAVRFAATAPSLFCVHCHCGFCRRAHGAAFVTWLGLAEERFELSAGDDALTWFSSSKQGRRGFCSHCGTTLFFASTLALGEMHVVLACVDDPIDTVPTAHVFDDQRVPWLDTFAGLTRLGGDSDALSKYSSVEPNAP